MKLDVCGRPRYVRVLALRPRGQQLSWGTTYQKHAKLLVNIDCSDWSNSVFYVKGSGAEHKEKCFFAKSPSLGNNLDVAEVGALYSCWGCETREKLGLSRPKRYLNFEGEYLASRISSRFRTCPSLTSKKKGLAVITSRIASSSSP